MVQQQPWCICSQRNVWASQCACIRAGAVCSSLAGMMSQVMRQDGVGMGPHMPGPWRLMRRQMQGQWPRLYRTSRRAASWWSRMHRRLRWPPELQLGHSCKRTDLASCFGYPCHCLDNSIVIRHRQPAMAAHPVSCALLQADSHPSHQDLAWASCEMLAPFPGK